MVMNPALVHVGTTAHDHVTVSAWCAENFGEFNVGWYRLGSDPLAGLMMRINGSTQPLDIYYFATEEDLALFLLRWS